MIYITLAEDGNVHVFFLEIGCVAQLHIYIK